MVQLYITPLTFGNIPQFWEKYIRLRKELILLSGSAGKNKSPIPGGSRSINKQTRLLAATKGIK